MSDNHQISLIIKIVNWGSSQREVDAAKVRVEQTAAVQNKLRGTKHRLVGFEYIDDEATDKSQPTAPPKRFRVTFYDYTNDRAVIAENDFAGKEAVGVRTEMSDPGVSGNELQAAYLLGQKSDEFADLFRRNQLEFDAAMPPVFNLDGERLINLTVKKSERRRLSNRRHQLQKQQNRSLQR